MLLDRGSKPEPAASGPPPQNLMTHEPLLPARSTPVREEATALSRSSGKLDALSLATWVSVQSLLIQFSNAQVRADLINGRFGCHINPQLLNRIDDLRWTLLPRWQSGSLSTPKDRERKVVDHMIKLLSRSEELLLVDSPEKCLTYKEWFSTLETIDADRYWSRVPCEQRCTHIVASDSDGAGSSDSAATPRNLPEAKLPAGKALQRSKKPMFDRPVPSKYSSSNTSGRKKNGQAAKVEEIIISSTDSSSDEAYDAHNAHTPFIYQEATKIQHLHHIDRRSVVTPPPFEMDGKTHLKDFLITYEKYFHKQFNGDSFDKSHMLSTFLSGDLLSVFHIKGGRKTPYEEVKCHLLEYYKKKKIGGKNFWKKELAKTTLGDGETYEIYGMRLAELAKLAYPEDQKECARNLRQCFLQAMPTHISAKIVDTEKSLKISSGGSTKYLPFSSLVEVAMDLQTETGSVAAKTVMWASQPSVAYQSHFQPPNVDTRPQSRRQPQERGLSRPGFCSQQEAFDDYCTARHDDSQVGTLGNKSIRCTHCRIPGHHRDECWRRSGSCLICGRSHFIESCPKYDPSYRSRSRTQASPARHLN
jgi:hypothetical protein